MSIDFLKIFELTSEQYCERVFKKLGKGIVHAQLIYEEWFRTGKVTGNHPAFNNAKKLFDEIVDMTNFDLLSFSDRRDDGTTGKILLQTHDHLEVETVLIPMQAGGTICVSSQVGCKMGCAFCETARMGLLRSLTTHEIVSQVFVAKFILNFDVRNVVFMGMGEPFDNYDNVLAAARILADPHGLGIGYQHITISTSGRVDGIQKLMNEPSPFPNLAVSLNASNDEIRNKLMPINRTFSMLELKETMHAYNEKTGKDILVAYVLIKDRNDTLENAEELAQFLTGLKVKVNLIPYNRQSHDRFEATERVSMDAFAGKLRELGFYTLIRQTKGDKVMAACGQLGNLKLRGRKYAKKEI